MGSLYVEKPACTPPVLATVPAHMTVNAGSVECGASVTFAASATGTPAPGILYKAGEEVITSPHVFPVGTTTVTAIAANGCGRVTKSFTVTVVDKTSPVPVVATLPEARGECSVTVTAPRQATTARAASRPPLPMLPLVPNTKPLKNRLKRIVFLEKPSDGVVDVLVWERRALDHFQYFTLPISK